MKTLTIENLLYEELVMLQEIVQASEFSEYVSNLDPTERQIYHDLYEKIMQS